MRFWDTSAIVPLIVEEAESPRMRELLRRDDQMVVWWATVVECWSALARRYREDEITAEVYDQATANLAILQSAWYEVNATEAVRGHARRVLRLHKLRAADALQLAAARAWSNHTELSEFVSLDENLRGSARAEGFILV